MQYHNHKDSPFDLQPLEWILKAEAGLHSLQYLVVAVLRSPKNAQFQTSVLTCWRLWRLYSKFKIHSRGCKSNGEALWLCYRLFFLIYILVFWHFWPLEKTISEMRHPVYPRFVRCWKPLLTPRKWTSISEVDWQI